MIRLNKQQKKAAHTSHRVVYVDAGPGTGKTTVIEARVKYLISINVGPREILVLAFNKSVVAELKTRLGVYGKINIRTFHSLGCSIIKRYSGNNNFNFLSDEDKSKLITQIKNQHTIKNVNNIDIMDMLSICRENSSNIKKYSPDLQKIYRCYVETLKREKLFDHAKLIRRANAILQKGVELRNKLCQQYGYILVDEFQDMSESRFKLLRLLTCDTTHLFMVGDEDQQILEWSGVRNNNLRKLQKYYPNLQIYPLEGSYRLTPQIARIANNLIRHSKKRIDKTLKPLNQQNGYLKVKRFDNSDEEARWCINKIEFLLRNGVDKKDIAVLVRQEKILYDTVKKTGVVCSTIHKIKGLEFQHVIVLGVERGIFNGSIEEERRLLYVAVTRAIKSLVLTFIDDGMRKVGYRDIQVQKSPLLDELYR